MGTKLLYRLGVFGLIAFLTVSAVSGVFLAEVTLHPARHALSSGDEVEAQKMARLQDSTLANVNISARDGVLLRAWSIRPRNNNGTSVILLHGLADNRVGMTGYAEFLLSRGFSVLLPDARAHGNSGGILATFGILESDDIHRWLDWVEQNDRPDCIFGLGESMGAALLLESLRSETRYCAVAAESSFASFREIGYDRIGQFFHAGPWLGRTLLRPTLEFAFVYARWRYKLDFERVSPENAVAETKTPVFLIHGQSDRNIPVRHSLRIASRNPAVSLWEVPNADHCGAVGASPDQFDRKLVAWFDRRPKARRRSAARTAYLLCWD